MYCLDKLSNKATSKHFYKRNDEYFHVYSRVSQNSLLAEILGVFEAHGLICACFGQINWTPKKSIN